MFGKLFGNKQEPTAGNDRLTAFKQELDTLEQRWYVFLDKLEEKHRELVSSVETEGPAMYAEDTDPYKRAFQRFKSGMNGQFENIRTRAYNTCDQQIRDYYNRHDTNVFDPARDLLFSWRERCLAAYDAWEKRISRSRDEVWAKAEAAADPEEQYQSILDEYRSIKDQFRCSQCGSPIAIDRIFFISTYIACPACGTQNTFAPSTQARSLEHLARTLAERRTASLLAAYEAEKDLQYKLYNEMHEVRYSAIPESAKKTQLAEMESRRLQAVADAPGLYRNYLRAMFDEWNAITPDLKEQNERFYERQLADFNKMND